jgi:outer membrane protein OmpA-like peptidoglycan-associated protein
MHRILPIALFLISTFSVEAQLNTGINTSSWGGVSNTTWNPSIADGRYSVDVSVGAINSGYAQNNIGLNAESPFKNATFNKFFGLTMLNSTQWSDTFVVSFAAGNKIRNINQWAQIEGPGSFMIPIKSKLNAIAFSYHLNNIRNIRGLSADLGNWASGGDGGSGNFSNEKFLVTQAAWIDYSLTYSRVLLDKEKHQFKIGATFKFLQTLETGSVVFENFSGVQNSPNSIAVSDATAQITYSNKGKIGAASDIGFVYEFRPKVKKFTYEMDGKTDVVPNFRDVHTLAVGFSIMDIGALPTGKSATRQQTNFSSTNFNRANFSLFETQRLVDSLVSKGTPSAYSGGKNIWLPTRFNIFLDYNIAKGFGLNLNSSISPYFKSASPQVTYSSYVSLVPRFDLPLFGAYLPFSYHFNGDINLGASLRAGPVWFGLSDVIGMMTGKGMKNVNFYGGVKIPLYYHKPKDKDKDKVSDKFDKCPGQPGSWTTRGCADRDGDGVKDEEDDCPADFGSAETKGCPDRDGDGISDKDDDCPDYKGSVEAKGCPDRDGDGVVDKIDRCPDVPGPKFLMGCPDTDGDGIVDIDDKCPKLKGTLPLKGCPDTDTDGDGVYDFEDDDPETPGPKENHGKPYEDSDGDGIFDNEDKCPEVFGKKEFKGCPTAPKPSLFDGVESPYDTVYFEIDKKIISTAVEQKLRQFAMTMQEPKNLKWIIRLYGHTDNSEAGNSYGRERLSTERAAYIMSVLKEYGVQTSRFELVGYGDERPAGDNNTISGRKLNRRVSIYTFRPSEQ